MVKPFYCVQAPQNLSALLNSGESTFQGL